MDKGAPNMKPDLRCTGCGGSGKIALRGIVANASLTCPSCGGSGERGDQEAKTAAWKRNAGMIEDYSPGNWDAEEKVVDAAGNVLAIKRWDTSE